MIYTVTFNPSLDYIVETEGFKLGNTNRTVSERILPGGKGINVSTVLKNLGIESTALGFAAGFTGDEIRRRVEELGFRSEFIEVDNGFSRINVKMKEFDGTEINGQGPVIGSDAIKALMQKLDKLGEGDTLVLAGSIPSSMPDSIYSDILAALQDRGITFVVDATKDLLLNVLEYHPFLIKPNNHELGEMFDTVCETKEDIEYYARKLQEKGARNVLISMAGDGAILITEDGASIRMGTPKGKVINSVGAGDSMVAGFVAGYLKSGSYEEALKTGTAAGSATAFSEGLASREMFEEMLAQL